MVVLNFSNLDRGVIIPLTLLLAIAYPLYTLIYRLFFSPLSKIPGPWQTRISSVLEVKALKEQRRTQWVSELFEQNPGAIAVRTGPSSLSFNHPDAVKAIYGTVPLHPLESR
jgi:benzoate 4-monooxygenase